MRVKDRGVAASQHCKWGARPSLHSTLEIFGINVVNDVDFPHLIGEIFRFTAFLTTAPLNCYYLETTSACARIFRQMQLENLGLEVEPMNAENLDPLIKDYPYRKGFSIRAGNRTGCKTSLGTSAPVSACLTALFSIATNDIQNRSRSETIENLQTTG